MISRAAQARNVCLRCQLRLLAGPQPRAPPRIQAQPLRITSTRQLRLYSSENPWERLESAKEVPENSKKPSKSSSKEDSLTWIESISSKEHLETVQNDLDDRTANRPRPEDDSLEWLDQFEPTGPEEYVEHEIDRRRQEREPRRRTARGAPANYRFRDSEGLSEVREQEQGVKKERPHHGRIGSRRVTLQPEELDVEILGQRAHTIIMRDNLSSKPRRTIQEAAAEEGLTEEETEAAMRARVDALHEQASPEEALANIEELRPHAQLLSGNEFWSLHEVLSEGFTSAQVSHYIRANKKTSQTAKGSSGPADVREPRPWMARPYSLRPVQDLQLPPNASVKSRAVFTLMRTTWMLDIWERVEALNEVNIIFKDTAAAAALHTGHEGLDGIDRIRKELLQAGESLTFGDSSAQLRIVARRATAEAIIDNIEGLVNAISTETFVLCPPQSAKTEAGTALKNTLLNDLGRLTKTTPVLEDSGLVRVKWIKSQNDLELPGQDLEHMGHILWRLLYTAHVQTPSTAALVQDFISAGGVLNPVANAQDSTQALVDRLPSMIKSPMPNDIDTKSIWSNPEQTVSSTFGHVLFDHDNGTLNVKNLEAQDGIAVLAPTQEGQGRPCIFSAVVPRPDGLAALNTLAPGTPASTIMILRFAAGAPTRGAKYLLDPADGSTQIHPTSTPLSFLEIHVAVPDELPADRRLTWDASPTKHVRVISNSSLIDVPLPDRPIDIRLATSTISTLTDVEAVPALRAFVDASDLDLASGNLRTPPRLFIPESDIAPLSRPSAGEEAQSSRPGRKAKADNEIFEHRKGFRTFEFIGLEVRRAVELDYEGHKLKYTSIEAGLHGGRRAELALDMGLIEEGGGVLEHRAKYLDVARRIADGELVTWVHGKSAADTVQAELLGLGEEQKLGGENVEEELEVQRLEDQVREQQQQQQQEEEWRPEEHELTGEAKEAAPRSEP
ncbi:hypothetical protein ACHAQH_006926 [Verticillium albo-atrum]